MDLHAVVVAPVLVRVEMLRKGQTYELLITQHRAGAVSEGKRPPLETKLLFRGIHGRLELDLSGKDKDKAGLVLPMFYSLAGEEVGIPKRFHDAIRAVTKAVNCEGCFALSLCQSATERSASRLCLGAVDACMKGGSKYMQGRLKNYALVICLFVFLFVIIGGGLHLNPSGAFLAAAELALHW